MKGQDARDANILKPRGFLLPDWLDFFVAHLYFCTALVYNLMKEK